MVYVVAMLYVISKLKHTHTHTSQIIYDCHKSLIRGFIRIITLSLLWEKVKAKNVSLLIKNYYGLSIILQQNAQF